MKQHTSSIRNVLIGLGALSVLVAAGLAGFGLRGIQRQVEARDGVVVLNQALHSHADADAFMDDIRADVLRALQNAAGANKEEVSAIRADFQHHAEGVAGGIAENLARPLPPDLHDTYDRVARIAVTFVDAGRNAVELGLTDPVAGALNFEGFRHDFTALEDAMDSTRDVLGAEVQRVQKGAALTAASAREMILLSAATGIVFLVLITAAAVRIAGRIASDLAESREEAQRLSLHDALTGLPNRTFLSERLTDALAHAQRHGGMLAMLCLDLDRFKQVNDTLGHPIGDALLLAVAGRLRDCLRGSDTVARLGGDEFAVVQVPVVEAGEAGLLARRIVEALSEPYDLEGHQVTVGASVGIALAPADAADAGSLFKLADMALYRAKAEGRGTSRFFEPGMDAKLQARRVLEFNLRQEIATQDFELHHRPLVDLASGRVDALEALVEVVSQRAV